VEPFQTQTNEGGKAGGGDPGPGQSPSLRPGAALQGAKPGGGGGGQKEK